MNVGVGDPLFSDLDAIIRKTKQDMAHNITIAMDQPLKLVKIFNTYMWLMEDDVDEMLDTFITTETKIAPITRAKYYQQLVLYDNAMNDIQSVGFHNEAFILVDIQIGMVILLTYSVRVTRLVSMLPMVGVCNWYPKSNDRQNLCLE